MGLLSRIAKSSELQALACAASRSSSFRNPFSEYSSPVTLWPMAMQKTTKPNSFASNHAAALVFIWLIAGGAYLNYERTTPTNHPTAQAQSRINPNTAPWNELTELPRIGPTLAQRILIYRQTHRNTEQPGYHVFTSAQDLAAVRGIGVKTIERIKPLLRFDPK